MNYESDDLTFTLSEMKTFGTALIEIKDYDDSRKMLRKWYSEQWTSLHSLDKLKEYKSSYTIPATIIPNEQCYKQYIHSYKQYIHNLEAKWNEYDNKNYKPERISWNTIIFLANAMNIPTFYELTMHERIVPFKLPPQ